MNTAIIVAAGRGIRCNSDRPKQFLELLGKPVIIHTLERFEHCASVDEIILVLPVNDIKDFSTRIDGITKLKKSVPGGQSQAESMQKGFEAVNSASEIIAVHDGARPLVSCDEITQTIAKAAEVGAACLVGRVTDTIKGVEGDRITGTVDRMALRRALAPQAFRYEILERALSESNLDESITDECFLVETLGVEIGFVEGSPRNIKITHPDDLIVAESLIKASQMVVNKTLP